MKIKEFKVGDTFYTVNKIFIWRVVSIGEMQIETEHKYFSEPDSLFRTSISFAHSENGEYTLLERAADRALKIAATEPKKSYNRLLLL